MTESSRPHQSEQARNSIAFIRKRPGMFVGTSGGRGAAALLEAVVQLALDSRVHRSGWSPVGLTAQADGGFRVSWYGGEHYVAHHLVKTGLLVPPESEVVPLVFRSLLEPTFDPWDPGAVELEPLVALARTEVRLRTPQVEFTLGPDQVLPAVAAPCIKTSGGDSFTVYPDPTVLTVEDAYERMVERLETLSYCLPTAYLESADERSSESTRRTFHHPRGMRDRLEDLAQERGLTLGPVFHQVRRVGVEGLPPLVLDVAVARNEEGESLAEEYVNTHRLEAGWPTEVLTEKATQLDVPPWDHTWKKGATEKRAEEKERRQSGLMTALSVTMEEPRYEGNTRTRLASPEVIHAVSLLMELAFPAWLKEHEGHM